MQLTGIHHLTAVTAQARRNHEFYTRTLGLRLVKKTVNQDDVSAYHLFYADGAASPGCDLTFFDWPAPREKRGTRSVVRTGMRVCGDAPLAWWLDRFRTEGVAHGGVVEWFGRKAIEFEDFEGQRLALVADAGAPTGKPWERSPVPPEMQIAGLGPIVISVPELAPTAEVLTHVLAMRERGTDGKNGSVTVFEMGPGGPGAELHVRVEGAGTARQGAGGVHHVAFRVPTDEQYLAWARKLEEMGVPSSGPVDRFYFKSLYFREPGGVLFELATDGPGFATDEKLEALGERLALPPFLEGRRREIEAGLKPL